MAVYSDQFNIANVAAYLSKDFKNQVFNGVPFFAKLNAGNNKKSQDGGYTLRQPLLTGINNTADWQGSGYDELNFTPQAGVDKADFPIKIFTATVVMSELERAQNRGASEMIDLWEMKINQAKQSTQRKFNTDLYKDGTQNAAAITGLEAIVATTGTYAGISRSGNTFWQAGYTDSTSETITEAKMLTAFNSVSQNGLEYPDLIITTRAIWETFHGLLQDNVRYEDKEMANLGFRNLTFMGVPVVWDNDCPSGTMYFLNMKHIFLRYLAGYDMTWVKKDPSRQLVDAMAMRWYGNLTVDAVRYHGKLTGKS